MANDVGPLARDAALPYYDSALPAHDSYHARRVRDLALDLADECEQRVDRDTLAAAAWLHDIGRPLERTGEIDDHGDWAAEETATLLGDRGVPAERVDAVQRCIRSHSIRPSSPDPASIEAKLLFDADKLDATGARGLIRLACIVGERSGRAGEKYAVIDDAAAHDTASPNHPDVALLREWAEDRLDALYTPAARRVGDTRRAFMQQFFEQFQREIRHDPPE